MMADLGFHGGQNARSGDDGFSSVLPVQFISFIQKDFQPMNQWVQIHSSTILQSILMIYPNIHHIQYNASIYNMFKVIILLMAYSTTQSNHPQLQVHPDQTENPAPYANTKANLLNPLDLQRIMPKSIFSIYQQLRNSGQDQDSVDDCAQLDSSFTSNNKRLLQQQQNLLKKENYRLGREIRETEVFRKLKPGKEKSFRLKVLEENVKLIIRHNLNRSRTYSMKLNEFALFTQDEFNQLYLNLEVPRHIQVAIQEREGSFQNLRTNFKLSGRLDANELSQQTPQRALNVNHTCRSGSPLHQGMCGSCYAIATSDAGAIIKALYSQDGFYTKLSAQEIVSSNFEGTYGCKGGTLTAAFTYMALNGLHLEWSYPYRNQFTDIANNQLVVKHKLWKIKDFSKHEVISQGDCQRLIEVLQKKPVAVAISVQFRNAFYSSGTLVGPARILNHGVVLVGFDASSGYWIKNSWGRNWGYAGYGQIGRQKNIGICQYAVNIITEYEKGQETPLRPCQKC